MEHGLDNPSSGRVEVAPGVLMHPADLVFSFSSSGGPGGQNVNKRATKAELRVRLDAIPVSALVRDRLVTLAGRRLNDEGELVLVADERRSQAQNKGECLDRLRALLVEAQAVPRKRRKTRPTRGSVERRLENKSRRSERKQSRRSGGHD